MIGLGMTVQRYYKDKWTNMAYSQGKVIRRVVADFMGRFCRGIQRKLSCDHH